MNKKEIVPYKDRPVMTNAELSVEIYQLWDYLAAMQVPISNLNRLARVLHTKGVVSVSETMPPSAVPADSTTPEASEQ